MPAHITRSRVVVGGFAVLALAVVTGCGSAKEPAAAPTTSAPSASQEPTESAAPSETTAPAEAPAGSATLAKSGTHKFGETANVKLTSKGGWIGALKVTALEKAPTSDYKELGVRDDAGSVYYLRYDITYVSGKTSSPPEGSDLNWSKLTPLATQDQRLQLSNTSRFKKCTVNVYKADGTTDRDKRELKLGDTATNMCNIFLLDKGTVSQVLYNNYDLDTKEDLKIIWK
jgi:hypothetical protein